MLFDYVRQFWCQKIRIVYYMNATYQMSLKYWYSAEPNISIVDPSVNVVVVPGPEGSFLTAFPYL